MKHTTRRRSAVMAGALSGLLALTVAAAASAGAEDNVAYAKAKVAAAAPAIQSFKAPGPALTNVKSLAGKTVYYIPATAVVPLFKAVGDSMTGALQSAGVKVQVCDGKSNPAAIADCFTQAITAKAGAIVAGSIPAALAPNAFAAAAAAKIPIVNTLTVPAGPGDPKLVGYVTPNFIGFQQTMADYVIANSNAAANVLVVEITDTPATKIWVEQGALPEYKAHCPKCKVTTIKLSTSQFSKLPTLISTALIKDPNIKWIHSEADFAVQPIQQGLQSSPRGSQVSVVSMDGTLPVLQLVKAGRVVKADMGYNLNAFGWYAADQALRMMTGASSIQMEQFPYTRLFQQANASRLNLTPAAQNTGEWYGSTDYQAGFKKLWGVG